MELLDDIRTGGTPSFSTLRDALGDALPWLHQLADTPQDPDWHAEGDVAVHTEMVLDELYALLEDEEEGAHLEDWARVSLVLAALCHDVAKPVTTKRARVRGTERVIAPRHAMRGRDYLALRLLALDLPVDVMHDVLALVGYHHHPKRLVLDEDRGEARPWLGYQALARRVDLERVRLLELADMRGRRCVDRNEQIGLIELFGLMTIEYGVVGDDGHAVTDPLRRWRQHLRDALAATSPWVRELAFAEAVRDRDAGLISTSDEAVARSYRWREKTPCELVVTVGPSGAGKSRLVCSLRDEGWDVISLDALRAEIAGDPADQSCNGRVVAVARERLRELLRARRRIVWDATSLRRDLRAPIVGLGMDYDALVTLAVFLVPPVTLHARNSDRATPVPADVLARQIERFEVPTVDEAHRIWWIDTDGEIARREGGLDPTSGTTEQIMRP